MESQALSTKEPKATPTMEAIRSDPKSNILKELSEKLFEPHWTAASKRLTNIESFLEEIDEIGLDRPRRAAAKTALKETCKSLKVANDGFDRAFAAFVMAGKHLADEVDSYVMVEKRQLELERKLEEQDAKQAPSKEELEKREAEKSAAKRESKKSFDDATKDFAEKNSLQAEMLFLLVGELYSSRRELRRWWGQCELPSRGTFSDEGIWEDTKAAVKQCTSFKKGDSKQGGEP
ncbi:hypothetical protein BJ508DRAFT_309414 [Ascobolus immersus RN42]|uniref:Uncharacterized protein n=1 Tax=Ascobolus immersus RN42 TaxID=1160509 RepID=A0A3N4HWR4_ASCIM|nr:hypothetical protein BJ508DRAFT_309414 [Ascobolus immersus RN42]